MVAEIKALADLLSREQQQVLAQKLYELKQIGFGELTIVIRNGDIRFIQVKSSVELHTT